MQQLEDEKLEDGVKRYIQPHGHVPQSRALNFRECVAIANSEKIEGATLTPVVNLSD